EARGGAARDQADDAERNDQALRHRRAPREEGERRRGRRRRGNETGSDVRTSRRKLSPVFYHGDETLEPSQHRIPAVILPDILAARVAELLAQLAARHQGFQPFDKFIPAAVVKTRAGTAAVLHRG